MRVPGSDSVLFYISKSANDSHLRGKELYVALTDLIHKQYIQLINDFLASGL